MTMNWNPIGLSDDDFICKTDDGYTLRVEQMDDDVWWWDVTPPEKSGLMEARDGICFHWWDAPNEEAAKYAAECAYAQMRRMV